MNETNNSDVFIFWLYGWSSRPGLQSYENLIKCEVTANQLRVFSNPEKRIALLEIQTCKEVRIGGSANRRSIVEIVLSDQSEYYSFPANPLHPSSYVYGTAHEVLSLINTINSLKQEINELSEPNPYKRQYQAEGRPAKITEMDWDANVSPWHYYPPVEIPPMKFVLATVAGFILFLLVVILIVGIFGGIHISFHPFP